MQACNFSTEAYEANGLEGKLGTYAIVYEGLNHDLVKPRRTLGHANINSTVAYPSLREEEIDAAILAA